MKKPHLGFLICLFYLLFFTLHGFSQSTSDAAAMQALKKSLKIPASLDWSDADPCKWAGVQCASGKVTRIQIGKKGVAGTLPEDIKSLSSLIKFEVMGNEITGPLPSFAGLSSLEGTLLHDNKFSSIPPDFFKGLTSLKEIAIDSNPFEPWVIPESLKEATALTKFSANSVNLTGTIPDIFGSNNFASLTHLHLANNQFEGGLPASFASSMIESLWLNGQKNLNGTISVLQNMTSLTQVWLNMNKLTGPIPDLSQLGGLNDLNLRDNQFTGVIPASLVKLQSLITVNLTNNLLQGPTPKFDGPKVDMIKDTNSFCLSDPGVACDNRVNILLSVVEALGYPAVFAESWKGNDPCASWKGIGCNTKGNITSVNFRNMGLPGTIATNFSQLPSLTILDLSGNKLTGVIPSELGSLTSLTKLDVSNNNLYGQVPTFKQTVNVVTAGNPNFGKEAPPPTASPAPPGSPKGDSPAGSSNQKKSQTAVVVGSVVGAFCALGLLGVGVCLYSRKRKNLSKVQSPNAVVIHPRHSGDQDAVKVTVASSSLNGGGSETYSQVSSSGHNDIHVVEAGNMVISIQVLRSVTNNFSDANILGRGGFGTVYKGELHDGTKIAVKRMESTFVNDKGLGEFKSEIAVLTKVRHRHLVALLGYCLDGNERLLVYEYMPQGTLSSHLFNWKEEGLKPLEWTRRLTIALDVARGVEYLHGLAHQSFIHRDLKPSNILLGDDMRAKVADFGLVRLAPEGKYSIETRLAGTFGYLAPEYAVTGRVTTKVDVFSFGVILMELITGRRALDETQPEDSLHLVTWFRRMHINKDTFRKAIDQTIELDEETLASISTVAELAGHCSAREPYQRPDMGHVVNVLSSLAELWKPAEMESEDMYGIDFDMTLPQALKKWQAFEGDSNVDNSSSFFGSSDNTQTSIPTRPSGFADSFQSTDGR